MNHISRLMIVGILCASTLGGLVGWTLAHRHPLPPPTPPVVPVVVAPAPGPVPALLDALARTADKPEQASRYVTALAALGPDALPELRERLQKEGLPTEVLSAYASALIQAGREQALGEAAALWRSPRATPSLHRALAIALCGCRSPEAGSALLALWTGEGDPEAQSLLAQALKANPQVNGPLIATAWAQAKDEAIAKRFQALALEVGSQANQREEARNLLAMDVATPRALETLRGVLADPSSANKSLALSLLERRGDAEARKALLAFARAGETDPGLRSQALSILCRKADAGEVSQVVSWYRQAAPEVREDILYAIGQSGNLAFLDFVTAEAGQDTQAARAKDLLEQARNRRTLGLE